MKDNAIKIEYNITCELKSEFDHQLNVSAHMR